MRALNIAGESMRGVADLEKCLSDADISIKRGSVDQETSGERDEAAMRGGKGTRAYCMIL